jgi:hypothetical protein
MPNNWKISELTTAEQLSLDDIVEVSIVDGESPTGFVSRKMTLQELADLYNVEDLWVDTTGDTMTGDLVLVNTEDEDSTEWTHTVGADGTYTLWADGDYDKIMAIHPGTASAGNSGQLITGRFRYSRPVPQQNSGVLNSGSEGVTTGMVYANSSEPVTLQIRALTGDAIDFDVGNFFSVVQMGDGQITLEGETASVILLYPSDRLPATRTRYSVITATYVENDSGDQYWVLSEDLAISEVEPLEFGVDNGSVFASSYQVTLEDGLPGFVWGDTFTIDYDEVIPTATFTWGDPDYTADNYEGSGTYAGTLTQGVNSWPVLVTFSSF